jgi:hypothetical protein
MEESAVGLQLREVVREKRIPRTKNARRNDKGLGIARLPMPGRKSGQKFNGSPPPELLTHEPIDFFSLNEWHQVSFQKHELPLKDAISAEFTRPLPQGEHVRPGCGPGL